jgi:uncharacterized SAM-binding protein YcdF (DUF218 family)
VARTLTVLAVVLAATAWSTTGLGRWLVVEDQLAPAAAIAVLNGDHPTRALEAARLYHAGWAPEVWLTQHPDEPVQAAQAARGELVDQGTRSNLAVLRAHGVPPGALRVLPGAIGNTLDEIILIARALHGHADAAAIIVTSAPHTRRAATLWRHHAGHLRAIVRPARGDYDPRRWWAHDEARRIVVHEALGLILAWRDAFLGGSGRAPE